MVSVVKDSHPTCMYYLGKKCDHPLTCDVCTSWGDGQWVHYGHLNRPAVHQKFISPLYPLHRLFQMLVGFLLLLTSCCPLGVIIRNFPDDDMLSGIPHAIWPDIFPPPSSSTQDAPATSTGAISRASVFPCNSFVA